MSRLVGRSVGFHGLSATTISLSSSAVDRTADRDLCGGKVSVVLLSFVGVFELTLVLALLNSIILDLAAIVGVLHAWLDLAVGEGTCEAGEKLFGLLMACGLAWVERGVSMDTLRLQSGVRDVPLASQCFSYSRAAK